MARVLIAEDDAPLRRVLGAVLTREARGRRDTEGSYAAVRDPPPSRLAAPCGA